MRRGDRTDDDRAEAADAAADIEQHVLRGGPRRRREELADQRAIAAEHAVDEEAHDRAADQQLHGIGQARIDHDHHGGADHVAEEGRAAADPVGDMAEGEDAERHAGDGHRGPQGRLGELEAEPRGEVVRQPDHHAVIAEILDRAEDDHAEAELGGLAVLDQQAQRRFLRPVLGAGDEDLGLVQGVADEIGDDRRQDADGEHAAPADRGQQQRGRERRCQHADLPA